MARKSKSPQAKSRAAFRAGIRNKKAEARSNSTLGLTMFPRVAARMARLETAMGVYAYLDEIIDNREQEFLERGIALSPMIVPEVAPSSLPELLIRLPSSARAASETLVAAGFHRSRRTDLVELRGHGDPAEIEKILRPWVGAVLLIPSVATTPPSEPRDSQAEHDGNPAGVPIEQTNSDFAAPAVEKPSAAPRSPLAEANGHVESIAPGDTEEITPPQPAEAKAPCEPLSSASTPSIVMTTDAGNVAATVSPSATTPSQPAVATAPSDQLSSASTPSIAVTTDAGEAAATVPPFATTPSQPAVETAPSDPLSSASTPSIDAMIVAGNAAAPEPPSATTSSQPAVATAPTDPLSSASTPSIANLGLGRDQNERGAASGAIPSPRRLKTPTLPPIPDYLSQPTRSTTTGSSATALPAGSE